MTSMPVNVTVRLLRAVGVESRETCQAVLLAAVARQLPDLSVEDIGEVLDAFPPRPKGATG
jgi:hypothetical protein